MALPLPDHEPEGREVEDAWRRAAMREHSLLSLFELGRELSVALDLKGIANLVLLNLMGHLGTRKAVLWLRSEGRADLNLVHAYGVKPDVGRTLGLLLAKLAASWPKSRGEPLMLAQCKSHVEPMAVALAGQTGLAVLAPVISTHGAMGLVAVGPRVSGEEITALDLEVLATSLGMAAVAFENSRLYGRLQQQNRELARANAELIELDRMKTEFVQNVNHELRTPIAVAMGALECLTIEPEQDPERKWLLDAAIKSTGKLRDLVQTLLEFSASTGDAHSLTLEPFDARTFVAQYFEASKPRATESGHDLRLCIEDPVSEACGDIDRLVQVLDRLLDNALKFTPAGTRVELQVSDYSEEGVSWVRIGVSDNGPGIPADQLPRLFTPFYQADGSTTRAAGGMGVGLSAARRVAEVMSALLTVESARGKGTTFQLLLPRA